MDYLEALKKRFPKDLEDSKIYSNYHTHIDFPRHTDILSDKYFHRCIISQSHQENLYDPNRPIKRHGWRGFISMIRNLFHNNRVAKKSGKSFEITVKFPLKWFK